MKRCTSKVTDIYAADGSVDVEARYFLGNITRIGMLLEKSVHGIFQYKLDRQRIFVKFYRAT